MFRRSQLCCIFPWIFVLSCCNIHTCFGLPIERSKGTLVARNIPEPSLVLMDNGLVNTFDLSSDQLGNPKEIRPKSVSHIKASILTVGLFVLLGRKELSAYSGLVLFLYILECCTCSTRRYLSNCMTPKQLLAYLETLKETPMQIVWEVECYHYNDHTYRSRRHRGSRRKVVTHRAHQTFQYSR